MFKELERIGKNWKGIDITIALYKGIENASLYRF